MMKITALIFKAPIGYNVTLQLNSIEIEHTATLACDRLGIQKSYDNENLFNIA